MLIEGVYMAAAAPQPKSSEVQLEALKIKAKVDGLVSDMQKKGSFMPTRDQLDTLGEEIILLIDKYHALTANYERFLKAAIIDLTEVPEMSAQMQRISFLTALRDASKNLDEFIHCY